MRQHLPDWKLVSLTAAIATIASLSLAFSTPASMNVDGQRVVSDVAPVTTPGHAYLPIRAISDAAGAITTFDPQTGQIIVEHGGDTLKMKLGDVHATLNGRPLVLTHAPFSVRGRAMVSSTIIASAFGSSVKYDARRDRVEVRTPGVVVAGAPDDSP